MINCVDSSLKKEKILVLSITAPIEAVTKEKGVKEMETG